MPWDVMPDLFFYRDPEEVLLTVMEYFTFLLLGGERRAG